MRALTASVIVVCALALTGCATQDTDPTSAKDAAPAEATASPTVAASESQPTGEIAVAEALKFTGTTVDGEQFDGASLAGKPAVIWFWAPWCPTCQGQASNVSSLAEEYDGKVNVVGVAGLSEDTAGIKDFADDTSGFTNLSDSPGDIWRRFGIVEQSVYTVIDANGKVVSEGYLSDEELNDLVADLAG